MKNLFWGLSLAVTALLAACSSGSGTNSEPLEISSNSSSGADLFAETFDDLPVCTVNREGAIAYVKDEKAAYACEGGDWTLDDEDSTERKSNGDTGNDDKSSASEEPESSVSEEPDSSASEEPDSSASEAVEGSSASVPGGSSDASVYDADKNTLKDLRDGQTYKTTTIDIPSKSYSEVWMAENLNFVTDNSWCYNDESDNCDTYGRLYTWDAAVGRAEDECGDGHTCGLGSGDIRGACPKGWHLPSQAEWEALIVAVDGSITEYTSSNTAGTKLKSATGWTAYSGITNEDAFGFSALPAGTRYHPIGNYGYKGYGTYFWSSTEEIISYPAYRHAYLMGLDYGNDYAGKYDNDKVYGHSVRCIKDSE